MKVSVAITFAVLILLPSAYEPTIKVDHNANTVATKEFKFKTVSSPMKDDAAAKAKLVLVDGELDSNGADLVAVTDGLLPTDQDEPAANFFFNAGTPGGRFRFDFGRVIDIAQVNTYSWHPNTRGPQVYKLYGSDGSDPKFNADPNRSINPSTVGWTLVASVNTGGEGGQYAVGITDPIGSLGKFRHLLFDCSVTSTSLPSSSSA